MAHFNVYKETFPQFPHVDTDQKSFYAWQKHIADLEGSTLAFCIIEMNNMQLVRRSYDRPEEDLIFCDIFSRQPKNEVEQYWYTRTQVIAEFAMKLHEHAAYQLLSEAEYFPTSNVGFSLRLEYFLRYVFESPIDAHPEGRNALYLKHHLSGVERAALDDAIARKDISFVLNGLTSCDNIPEF